MAGSGLRQVDLDAVAGSHGQQFLDLFLHRRQGRRGTFRQWYTNLEEHLLQPCRRNRNQHSRRFTALVLEGMGRPDRHVCEHPGTRYQTLLANRERDLAFEDVEALLLPAVDVWRWTAARKHDRFPQGVLAVGVV